MTISEFKNQPDELAQGLWRLYCKGLISLVPAINLYEKYRYLIV